MKTKVLIITYQMVPYSISLGSCQRMYYLAQYLANDNSVEVLAYKNDKYKTEVSKINEKFVTTFLDQYGNKEKDAKVKPNKLLKIVFKSFRHIIMRINPILNRYFYNEPNKTSGLFVKLWLINSRKEILRKLKTFSPEVIIISSPPFVLLSLVSFMKKNSKAKVLLDYRDQWNYFKDKGSNLLRRRELKHIILADKIVVFSEKFRNDFCQFYNIPPAKVLAIYNGFHNNSWNQIKPLVRNSKFIITYTGTYSFDHKNFADISAVLQALLVNPNRDKILLRLIGCEFNSAQTAWKKLLGGCIEFVPPIDQLDANNYLKETDVALLIYNYSNERSKYMLTGKFFDYLASRTVILGIGEKNTNFNELIEEHKLGYVCNYNEECIYNALEYLFSLWRQNRLQLLRRDESINISFFSRDNQNYKYNQLIKQELSAVEK